MRYNDNSSDCERWTNAKLMREARKYANLESFAGGYFEPMTFTPGWANQTNSPDVADFCREQTRIYRETWLKPIMDEIARRFCK